MSAFGCVNHTIRLRSGKYFDLADPRADQFEFSDIAGALSKICRFGGQIDRFYSVAEHCYLCAMVAKADGRSVEVQRAALLHDAAEAFIGDMVKPLKTMLPQFGLIENKIENLIEERFGVRLHGDLIAQVKEIDHAMLIHERRWLFTPDKEVWEGERSVRRLSVNIACLSPSDAEVMFAIRAKELGIKIGSALRCAV